MPELNRLSATEAASGLAGGVFTAEALMRACLDRVARRDGDVRAWAWLDPDQALAAARAADAGRAAAAATGPLHGLPVGIKDVIDTADMPTEHGSPLFPSRRPSADAACVAALRAAGAIIMGKTVTTELANICPSKTRNPHDLTHSPGGSSAGSGAAVADCQVTLALGTQTGGSVIRPASFNGVYGFKPTLGLIPRAGVLMQSHTLDTVGVYGRALGDLALIADCLAIPEPADPYSHAAARGSLRAALASELPGAPKLAFLETPAWPEADAETRAAMLALVDRLGPACRRESLPAPFDRILDLHKAVFDGENAHYYGGFLRERPELLSDMLRARLEQAARLPAGAYIEALLRREELHRALAGLLERCDAVLCLASAGPAHRGFASTGSAAFNSPWTYLGAPSVSLPKLTVRGLPVGIQLVGARGGDARLLRVARWLDETLPGDG